MSTVCATCGGPVYEQQKLTGGGTGRWLHLRESDWAENVHQAVPVL